MMKRFLIGAAVIVSAATLLVADTKAPAVRSFEATYVGAIAALPVGAKRVDVWIPLPSDGPYQTVTDVKVDVPAAYTLEKDSAGNRLAHFVLDRPEHFGKDLEVRATYKVTRREALTPAPESAKAAEPPGAADLLKANRMVPLTPRVNLDTDRFDITVGRDLTLSPPQKDGALNFFIYPYVEVDGKAFLETKIRLDYRNL
jgi:hypothetical protein